MAQFTAYPISKKNIPSHEHIDYKLKKFMHLIGFYPSKDLQNLTIDEMYQFQSRILLMTVVYLKKNTSKFGVAPER